MELKSLVREWFDKWREGDYLHLPVSDDFKHTSPFGTVDGKAAYLELVKTNQDKFTGYRFEIHDEIYDQGKACVRYTAVQGDFKLDVSEWYYPKGDAIGEIIAYYHIGEIRQERRLEGQK
ncbi:MAG TPA: nuclear transport factor 2 family protein [Acidobacteriota bacterium]|nr:nuclear transport factor 2 family protein [Acidobacteriota bacterium]